MPNLLRRNFRLFPSVDNKRSAVKLLAEVFQTENISTNTRPLYLLNFLLPFRKVISCAVVTLKPELVMWKFGFVTFTTEIIVADFSSVDSPAKHLLSETIATG